MPETNANLDVAVYADDVLYGASNIAAYIGVPRRRVYDLAEKNRLPGGFKWGGLLNLRISAFLKGMAAIERGEQPDGAGNGAAKPNGA